MRGVVVLALAALAVAVSAVPLQAGSSPQTTLRIAYWERGVVSSKPDSVWTLRCDPAGGTLAQPARACARLAKGGAKLFAPVPPDTVCTEIYGGPQRARIVGKVRGKGVWVGVGRSNGCHISRWDSLAPWLLPSGSLTT